MTRTRGSSSARTRTLQLRQSRSPDDPLTQHQAMPSAEQIPDLCCPALEIHQTCVHPTAPIAQWGHQPSPRIGTPRQSLCYFPVAARGGKGFDYLEQRSLALRNRKQAAAGALPTRAQPVAGVGWLGGRPIAGVGWLGGRPITGVGWLGGVSVRAARAEAQSSTKTRHSTGDRQ